MNVIHCTLQNVQKYASLLAEKNSKLSEIQNEWIFDTFLDFHITNNLAVDIIHDIFESIARYNVSVILHDSTINKNKFHWNYWKQL